MPDSSVRLDQQYGVDEDRNDYTFRVFQFQTTQLVQYLEFGGNRVR